MLIEFRLSNFRSIAEEQVLSLVAASSENNERLRKTDGYDKPLLPAAAVYGANASGKTTVLEGLRYMRDAAVLSHRLWSPQGGTQREPFGWNGMPGQPSTFEVLVAIQGVRYQYGFRVDDERFLEEWLYAWPSGRKQTWLERDGDVFRFGEALTGEKARLIESVTRSNALFLSSAAQHRHDRLTPIFDWFARLRAPNLTGPSGIQELRQSAALWLHAGLLAGKVRGNEVNDAEKSRPQLFVDMLRAADLGIVDVRTEEVAVRDTTHQPGKSPLTIQVFLRHGGSDSSAWLPLEKESSGTITLFDYGPLLLRTLHQGGVVVVDELERSLHPVIALRLVALFNDSKTNPHNAQLIFSTHDTNLLGRTLGDPALRRDQVWLTEKNTQGATELYPLTDFKPRKDENLERGYLQGRYGAIPLLDSLILPVE